MYPFGHYENESNAALIASSNLPGKSPNDFMYRHNAASPIQTEDPEVLEEKIKSTFSMFRKNGN